MSNSIVAEFINQSKLCNMSESGREKGVPRPDFEWNPKESIEVIALPDPKSVAYEPLDVVDAIEKRMSIREYSTAPMPFQELSVLLWCTQGIKRVIPNVVALRNVPSAGARNALETFMLINRVEGLQNGLYKYRALEHDLLKLSVDEDLCNRFTLACDDQDQVKNSCVTFFWTAVADRMTWSYAERGYRYLFIDAGHVCQNLYLTAEKLNSGVCSIGHFDDDQVNQLLGIDGSNQFILYAATVGKR